MNTTIITKETIQTVNTINEARRLTDAAFNEHGENLKSISIFVYAEKSAGIEVKITSVEHNGEV